MSINNGVGGLSPARAGQRVSNVVERKVRTPAWRTGGFSMVELLVAMGVFLIILAFSYPVFTATGRQERMAAMGTQLSTRGERVVEFIASRLAFTGLSIPAQDDVATPLPGPCATNPGVGIKAAIDLVSAGNPYDELAFRFAREASPMLVLDSNAAPGSGSVTIATYRTLDTTSLAEIGPSGTKPARHLITFDLSDDIYSVTSVAGANPWTLSLGTTLSGAIPKGSPVLVVRQEGFRVSGDGNDLQLVSLAEDCSERLTVLDGNTEALQFQFIDKDGVIQETVADPADVRAVIVSLLIRSTLPDPDYTDPNDSYVVGISGGITRTLQTSPVNEKKYYRRLFTRIVEVRNIAY